MLDKIRERGAEMGRRLSVGRAVGAGEGLGEQPRRLSIGTLAISMERNTAGGAGGKVGGISPRSRRKRHSLDQSPGDISSHLYTAMVGALLADPAVKELQVSIAQKEHELLPHTGGKGYRRGRMGSSGPRSNCHTCHKS